MNPQAAQELMPILMFLVIFLIFYFLVIQPQNRKEKQRREMIDNLKRGDRVITIGGMIGEVYEIKGKIIVVKFNEEKIDFVKNAISQIYVAEK